MKIKIIMKGGKEYIYKDDKIACITKKKWLRIIKYKRTDDDYSGEEYFRGREHLLTLLIDDVESIEEEGTKYQEESSGLSCLWLDY